MSYIDRFLVKQKVAVITGGGGLIGSKHAEAVLEGQGIPILLDVSEYALERTKKMLQDKYPNMEIGTYIVDITNKEELIHIREKLLVNYGHIDILINNAANNPKVESSSKNLNTTRFIDFPVEVWNEDMAVGLTGAMLCAQVFGEVMERQKSGAVLNIGSDYGIIAPDQRVYRKEGQKEDEQVIKPVSYSVVKHGIIGLTKYLAIYWADKGIRVNTLCPASLQNGQDEEFVTKLSKLIPMGRMSKPEEYVCAVLFMISDASSYMTGSTVILDGGRTSW